MRFCMLSGLAGLTLFGLAGCTTSPSWSHEATIDLVRVLSADDMAGRGTGTPGAAAARAVIAERMGEIGLASFDSGYEQAFTTTYQGETYTGVNLVGHLDGRSDSPLTLVVTAHYDHLGLVDGEIYNGADDNASGVAGLLAVAEHFANVQPLHDMVFVALDREEVGHGGASSFVTNPPEAMGPIALNLNLDMLSRGDNGQLWAAGAGHRPYLAPLLADVAARAPVSLNMGFDGSVEGQDDWTLLSDHAAFHKAGIAFVYLGVEDHPDYHQPSDDFEKIDTDWYLKAVETAIMVSEAADAQLDTLAAQSETSLADN